MSDLNQIEMKQIVDFNWIERLSECSICLEKFNDPRILPCSHTYCFNCLFNLSQKNVDCDNNEMKITCPTCSEVHPLKDVASINMFPRNLALKQLIDIKPTQLVSDKYCEECNISHAFTNCLHCSLCFCLGCKEKHSEILKDEAQIKSNLLEQNCEDFIANFKKQLKEFLLGTSKAKKLIKLKMNDMINRIKEKEAFLCTKIDKLIEEKMNYFNQIQSSFIVQNNDIQQFLSQQSIKDLTEEKLLELNNKLDEHLILIKDLKLKQENKESINIKIDPIQLIKKLYELKMQLDKLDDIKLSDTNNNIFKNNAPLLDLKYDLNYAKLNGYHRNSETDFWNPTGLAFNADLNELFIADSFNHCCKVIDSQTGNYLRSSINLLDLKTPRDVFISENKKNIIISDSGNHRICIVDYENFKLINEFGYFGTEPGQFSDPRGVCVDSLNRIFICDRNNHRIQIFDYNGNFLNEFGSKGCDDGRFFAPEFIHISTNNQLLVSDSKNHRIQIFNISNDIQFISSFGSFGKKPGEFSNPKGVVTDAEGYIMVADCNNNRLQLFEPDGSFVTTINDGSTSLDQSVINIDRPIGISILNGLIAISNWGRTQKIQIF